MESLGLVFHKIRRVREFLCFGIVLVGWELVFWG